MARALPHRRPNFFIVGAPKAGTTSMHEYLAQHPAVFMSVRKEPRFFSPDLDSGGVADAGYFTRDLQRYLEFFAGARDEKIVGESSVCYLHSTEAARLIHEFAPDARILIMLRDPVELVEARHRQRVWGGREDILDLSEALAAEPERLAGRRIPPGMAHVKGLFYRHNSTLAPQVERYLDTFGRPQVHFVVLEEMAADVATTYRGVLEFLGVEADFQPDFGVRNAGRVPRYARLRRLPAPLRRARHELKRVLPAPIVRLAGVPLALRRLNSRPAPRATMSPALTAELTDYFASDVEALGRLVGRDLTALWPRFRRGGAAGSSGEVGADAAGSSAAALVGETAR